MPIITKDEIWKQLMEKYQASTNVDVLLKMEQEHPGIVVKTIQDTFNPMMLYQYTTLEALTLILSTKKLKLNSLKNVDDKIEGLSSDIGNMKKYFFASCWTSESTESIPMWNMYGKGMAGIRIGLPENPFVIHQFNYEPKKLIINKSDYIYIPDEYVINDDYLLLPSSSLLTPITYTDDEIYLKPKVIRKMELNSVQLEFGKIGKYKNKFWEFQKEVRYITNVFPGAGVKVLDNLPVEEHSNVLVNAIFSNKDIPIDAIYLDLEPERVNTIDILLGPKISASDKILIQLLCEKYAPNAVIHESLLTGKV